MIWGHIGLATGVNSPLRMVLSFFMPWFYFKSGMFFKHNPDHYATIKKNARSLLLPFAIMSLIGQVLQWTWLIVTHDHSLWHYLSPPFYLFYYGTLQGNTPLWFLTSLFFVKTFYNYISPRVNDWALIIVCGALGFTFYKWLPQMPPIISSQPLGLAYYILGKRLRLLQYKGWMTLVSVVIIIPIALYCPSRIGSYGNVLTEGSYLLFLPYALASIIVANQIAKMLSPYIQPLRIGKILISLGRNSMFFYTTHWLCIVGVRTVMIGLLGYDKHDILYLWGLIITIFVALPLVWLLTREHRFMILIFGR